MVTLSETRLSILPFTASSSSTLTLSAMIISNSDILLLASSAFSPTSFTVSVLADGEDTFPVIVAVWFLIITFTRSPFSTSVVVSYGVNKSDPSIRTYFFPSYSTMVPLTVVSVFISVLSFVTLTNWETRSLDKAIDYHLHSFVV